MSVLDRILYFMYTKMLPSYLYMINWCSFRCPSCTQCKTHSIHSTLCVFLWQQSLMMANDSVNRKGWGGKLPPSRSLAFWFLCMKQLFLMCKAASESYNGIDNKLLYVQNIQRKLSIAQRVWKKKRMFIYL